MAKYALSRILLLIPTLLGMSLLIFLMLRLLPGDIVDIIAGSDPTVDSAAREQLREAMGLTAPLPVQYLSWLGGLFQGDLGTSMRSGKPVGELLLASLPITVELAVVETAPSFKGDTATAGNKPAKVETGITVQVPMFVAEGDIIKVDTRDGSYLERVT